MESPDESKTEKKKKRSNKERKGKSHSPGSKKSPQKSSSKSSNDNVDAKSEDTAENKNDEVIKDTKVFLEGLKRSRRLSSTWLADYEHDEQKSPARASFDDHKVVLCETYPAEDSKIYTYEMEFEDEEFKVPTGDTQEAEQLKKEQAKKGKKKSKKTQKANEVKKAPVSETTPSKSEEDTISDVERNKNSSSEEVNVDSRQSGHEDTGDEPVSKSKKRKRSKRSPSRGKEGPQTEEADAEIESPLKTELALELGVKESKISINLMEDKQKKKKLRDVDRRSKSRESSPGKEDQAAIDQSPAETDFSPGLEVKESKRSIDLKKDSLRPKQRKETLSTELDGGLDKIEKKESRKSLRTVVEGTGQFSSPKSPYATDSVPLSHTERISPSRSSSLDKYGGTEQAKKSSRHKSFDDPKAKAVATKNDTEMSPLVSYRSVFRKFRRNPRKTLCDYTLREIDQICETFFLNKRLLTIGHFPRSPLFKASLKEIDQFCETIALTTPKRGSFLKNFQVNNYYDSVYNKLINYYVSDKMAPPTQDLNVKESFIEYVIYEDVPEIQEATSTDDSQSLKSPPLPASSKKKLATHLFQRKHYDL